MCLFYTGAAWQYSRLLCSEFHARVKRLISAIWLSSSPVQIENRFTRRPLLLITTRLLQPNPDILRTSNIHTLLQLVHVIHVASGGQICVIFSAVSLSFSPGLPLIYKVILMLNTFRYGAESCESVDLI